VRHGIRALAMKSMQFAGIISLMSSTACRALSIAVLLAGLPCATFAQSSAIPDHTQVSPPITADNYTPVTGGERVYWIVDGTVGPRSLLAVGPLAASWSTLWNSPPEWGQGWSGFGKRYLQREADVAISNTMEAGFGAIWGEDPRYIPSGTRRFKSRVGYVLKMTVLAQHTDGTIRPAWGRYLGNTLNNVVENTWLPPSQQTVSSTLSRSALGILGRAAGNAWDEFWPDAWKLLKKKL
jgi:hypothetical protein